MTGYEHFIYFPACDLTGSNNLDAALVHAGYRVRSRPSAADKDLRLIVATQPAYPSESSRLALKRLVEAYGGDYDGGGMAVRAHGQETT